MHTSGRSKGGRLGIAVALLTVFAGVALAAEISVADVPAKDAYLVTAEVVPGAAGADVCGSDRGQGHVNFRIGFGGDLHVSVNGSDAGTFDPAAAYLVTVDCRKIGLQWFATTRVVNQGTGEQVYLQTGYPMQGAAEQVRAEAEDVVQLSVR